MPLVEPPQIVQTQFTELTSDTTTTSASFVDLLSLTFETDNNALISYFSVACDCSSSGQDLDFQLVIDGSAQRGIQIRIVNSGFGTGGRLVHKSALLARGSHTVKIQWRRTGGTAQIRPATQVDEHASLLIREVTR